MRAYDKRRHPKYAKKYALIAKIRAYQAMMDNPKTKWPYLRARVLERQESRRRMRNAMQCMMGDWTSKPMPISLFTNKKKQINYDN